MRKIDADSLLEIIETQLDDELVSIFRYYIDNQETIEEPIYETFMGIPMKTACEILQKAANGELIPLETISDWINRDEYVQKCRLAIFLLDWKNKFMRRGVRVLVDEIAR